MLGPFEAGQRDDEITANRETYGIMAKEWLFLDGGKMEDTDTREKTPKMVVKTTKSLNFSANWEFFYYS